MEESLKKWGKNRRKIMFRVLHQALLKEREEEENKEKREIKKN